MNTPGASAARFTHPDAGHGFPREEALILDEEDADGGTTEEVEDDEAADDDADEEAAVEKEIQGASATAEFLAHDSGQLRSEVVLFRTRAGVSRSKSTIASSPTVLRMEWCAWEEGPGSFLTSPSPSPSRSPG